MERHTGGEAPYGAPQGSTGTIWSAIREDRHHMECHRGGQAPYGAPHGGTGTIWRATGEDAVVVAEKLLATGLLTNKKAQAYAIANSRKYPSGSMTRETLWKAATQERKAEFNEDGTYRR